MTNRKGFPNPFDSDVVIDPENPSRTDVRAIHSDAFDECRRAYELVATQQSSGSVLLYGEAGCGKTHLLSRFRRWLGGEIDPKPTVPAALFIPVRMEAAPTYIWRHVRRRFAEELLRREPAGTTYLEGILHRYLALHGNTLNAAFDNAPVRDLGLDLMSILEQYAAGRHRRLCRAWLQGDGMSEADLLSLNLPQIAHENSEEDVAEYDSRRFVLAMTRLCAPHPVVFCFDQVEAMGLAQLQSSYGAFSRMGAALIDDTGTGNSLVISTILVSFLRTLQDASMVSDYFRITKNKVDLPTLDWTLGRQLVDERLKLVPEIRSENPVSEADLRAFFRSNNQLVTPRRLIHEARRLFTLWKGQDKPLVTPPEFLRSEFDEFWTDAQVRKTPAATDEVLSQALPLALQLMGHSPSSKPAKHVDLAAGAKGSNILIAYANQKNMTSLAARLRKLEEDASPGNMLCIIRDARLPVSKTARTAQQRLDAITESGGRVVRVDAEALAALDAMRRLLAQATSGDLSLNGETLDPQTVREWLAANLPSEVVTLGQQILGEHAEPHQNSPDALLELLNLRKVLPLDEAAKLTELSHKMIEAYAHTHPNRIMLFGGSCPVVCQPGSATPKGFPSIAN